MTRLLLWLALAAAPASDQLARVDGVAIPAERVRARLALAQAAGAQPAPPDLLQDLIDDRLLAAEAERRGLGSDPAVAVAAEQARRRAGQELFEVRELGGAVTVSDEMLRQAYHSSTDWAQLLLLRVATRAEAQGALERLRAGGPFAAEAARSLDEASGQRGGDTGKLVRGQLEAPLAAAVFAAAPGALVGPIELRLGWAVAQVVEKAIGTDQEFAARRPQLLASVRGQVTAQARRHYVDQLRARAKVALDEPFLRTLGARLEATPAEQAHVLATLPSGPLRYGDVLPGVRSLARGMEGGHLSGPSVKAQVAWAEIDRRLLEDAAMQRDYARDPAVVAAGEWARQDAMTRLLADRLRAAAPAPTGAAVEAAYAARAASLRRPGQRRCAHILLADEREALALKGKLAAGQPFAALARAGSRDASSAPQGGELGDFTDERIAEVERAAPALGLALRQAPADVVTGPVKSPDGFHLLRCGPHQPARVAPLAEVRPALVAELTASAKQQAVRAELARLRAAARIELDPAGLAGLQP